MPIFTRDQVVLAQLVEDTAGIVRDEVKVTKTATMANGSLLVAAGTEAAAAAAATVTFVIDDSRVDQLEDGDVMTVSVVKAGAILNYGKIKFSDAAYAGEALPLMPLVSTSQIKEI